MVEGDMGLAGHDRGVEGKAGIRVPDSYRIDAAAFFGHFVEISQTGFEQPSIFEQSGIVRVVFQSFPDGIQFLFPLYDVGILRA